MIDRSASLVVAQVIICGRPVDKVTEKAVPEFTVRLLDRGPNPAVAINPADLLLTFKLSPGGYFGYFGVPGAILLDETTQYRWRVEITATGYQTMVKNFQFGPLAGQPELVDFTRPVPGDTFSVRLFRAGLPQFFGDLKMEA